jgi:DNA polymerase elongation subunit (family B)
MSYSDTNSFNLSKKDKNLIIDYYATSKSRKQIQEELSDLLNVSERTVRAYAKSIGINQIYTNVSNDKVMVYDIETSRVKADLWWTGKQYVDYHKLRNEPKIISISWKWVGEDEVYALTWDKNHCDKRMLEKFLKEFNKASMVIGQNNDRFDNKWIKTRAAKHGLFVNRFTKSFDIYKHAKKHFRLPSYSMDYMSNYFGLTPKQKHDGIIMWEKCEYGTKEEQKEYLGKMVDYNKGDIVTTEELYLTLRPYFATVTNKAVASGLPKWACPVSGSKNVKLLDTLFTEMGTVQRVLYCEDSKHQYKVSNKVFMDYLGRNNSWNE